MEPKSIKETLELLAALKLVSCAGAQIAADKELSMKDIAPMVELAKKYEVVIEGIKGLPEVLPEAKDLDMLELSQIGAAVMDMVKAIKASYEAGK